MGLEVTLLEPLLTPKGVTKGVAVASTGGVRSCPKGLENS
jgi:hypothetical protein